MKTKIKSILPNQIVNRISKYRQNQFKINQIKKYFKSNDIGKILSIIKLIEEDYGHLHSVKQREPINSEGQAIPWYTYPAIEYLSQLSLKDKEVGSSRLGMTD